MMSKRFLSVFCILLLVYTQVYSCFVVTTASDTNLVVNGDFENAKTGWSGSNLQIGKQGVGFFRANGTSTADAFLWATSGIATQNITLNMNTNYTLSAKLTTFDLGQQGIVGIKDSGGNIISEITGQADCINSFVNYSTTFAASQSGTYTVYLMYSNPSLSKVSCFDDITLIEVGPATPYNSTVTAGDGGLVIGGSGNYVQGALVKLHALPFNGFEFSNWEVISGGIKVKNSSAADTTFSMPANDVAVKANFISVSGGLLSVPATVKSYPYYVNPQEYPEYEKRPYHTMNWADFNNSVQFVAGRQWPSATLDASRTVKGTVWRPNSSAISSDAQKGMQYIKDQGYFLHNIGGYLPGEQNSNLYTPDWFYNLLTTIIPNRFTGMDIGEQDQRLNFQAKNAINPFTLNKKISFLKNREYMSKVGEDQGDWGSLLSCMWYWQYPAKDNQAYLLGAETQNKVTNPQIHFSNLRGAGKQYGILWYGDIAFCDAVYKTYTYDAQTGTYIDNGKGGSPAFIKRSYYSQYAYNATILSLESGWTGGWASSTGALTPIGQMHNDAFEMVRNNPRPGTIHTPIAMMNDFYQGFMPARQVANTLQTWNKIPYEAGDYLTDSLYSMFYPKYEDCGYFQNEQGAISNTPYGDCFDTLLSDSRLEIMKQYPVIYASSDMISADDELLSKVEAYVNNGGYYVVTADNAKKLWPTWYNSATKVTYPANTSVLWANGNQNITEPNDFEVYQNLNMPANCVIDAKTSDNKTVVAEIGMGNGKIILINSPYGLNKTQMTFNYNSIYGPTVQQQADNIQSDGSSWKDMGRPYQLSKFAKIVYENLTTSQQIFTLTDDQSNTNFSGNLQYIVDVLGNNQYTITVLNNSNKTKYFNINSKVGQITNKTEISTFKDMTKESWYGSSTYFSYGINPLDINGNEYTDTAAKVADATSNNKIFAGDVRIFKITVNPNQQAIRQMETLTKVSVGNNAANRILAVKDFSTIEQQITLNPTFFDKFDGIKVDWAEFKNIDKNMLQSVKAWLKRHNLKVIVDFSSGFSSGQLTLNYSTNASSAYYKTIAMVTDILDKMTAISSAKDIVISSDGQTANNLAVQALSDIAGKAAIIGAKLHYADSTNQKAIQMVNQINLSNLFVKLNATGDYNSDIANAGAKLGIIYAQVGNGTVDYSGFVNASAIKVLDKLYAANEMSADQQYGIDTQTLNSLYADYKGIFITKNCSLTAPAQILSDTNQTVNPANQWNTLTLRGIGDLKQTINNIPDFFKYYGAVNVDYRYFLNRDTRQLEAEKAWFEAKGIKIVVDFTEDITHYPGLTFVDLVPQDYQRTLSTFDDVIRKMSVIGSDQMIITTHAAAAEKYATLCSTVNTICANANQYGITVNVSTARNKYNGSYDDPNYLKQFIVSAGSPANLKIALNLDFLPENSNLDTYRTQCGNLLNMVIYGAPGSDLGGISNVDLFANTNVNISSLSDVNGYKIISDGYTCSENYLTNSALTAKAQFALTSESQIPSTTTVDFIGVGKRPWDYYNAVNLNASMLKLQNSVISNPNNIVTNGSFTSFETGVLPTGWLLDSFNGKTTDLSTGLSAGSYWIQNATKRIKQTITLQPNKKYHVSAYFKARGYTSVSTVFGIGKNNSSASNITSFKTISIDNSLSDSDFVLKSFDFTTSATNPTYGYCIYYQTQETANTPAGSPYLTRICVAPAEAVTSIGLDYSAINLTAKSQFQLSVNIYPTIADNKDVVWSTNNSAVATVNSSGIVTGVLPGTATITATSSDSGKTAVCTITVLPILTCGISLNQSSIEVPLGSVSNLVATVYPSDATNKMIVWSSSNPTIATVDGGGNITGISEGIAVISAYSSDGGNISSCVAQVTLSGIPNYYKIQLSSNNKVIDAVNQVGTSSVMRSKIYSGANSQQWQILNASHGYFKIINKFSGLSLDISNNNIVQKAYSGVDSQLWQLSDAGMDCFEIVNKSSKMVIRGSDKDLAAIVQSADTIINQKWLLAFVPNNNNFVQGVSDGETCDLAGGNLSITYTGETATLNGVAFAGNIILNETGSYILNVTTNQKITSINFTVINSLAPSVNGVKEGAIYSGEDGVLPITFSSGAATLNGNAFISGNVVSGTGDYTLTVKDNGSGVVATRHFWYVKRGDVNGDGAVDIGDLSYMKMHLLKSRVLSSAFAFAGDIDPDGKITIGDLMAVKKSLLGILKL